MAFDREDTLKKAEKLLRQGRLEPAVAAYLRVTEADPGDWITANTLGDLYVRAGQSDKAAAQYGRVAEHFMAEGFYSKAGAIFKKLLKLKPEDEASQLRLADISHKQGLLADAKAYLNAVASRRRGRGDRAGAAEIVVRLGSVDPNDFDARLAAARTVAEMGDEEGAAARLRGIYEDLVGKDRLPEAMDALRQAVALSPHDQEGRATLARAAVAAGDLDGARVFLDRETAAGDPALLAALVELELCSGRFDEARALVPSLLALGAEQRQKMVDLAWSTAEASPEGAFVLIEAVADQAAAAGQVSDAASLLQELVTRVPNQIPALLKLVEVCVGGGLERAMNEALAQLADAYLAAGQAVDARATAEDLVARAPWERSHIDRFRRALVMLKVPDPDTVIAERLGGQLPFLATDVFASAPSPEPDRKSEDASVMAEAAIHTQEPPAEADPPPAAAAGESVSSAEPGRADPSSDEPADHPPSDAGEIDLTNALGGLHSDPAEPAASAEAPAADGLAKAFQDARQQVTGRSGTDQSVQHMTLARTYLEMGMPDQALASLGTAARSPEFRFEAAASIGRIYKDRGDAAQAVEWLERASEAPAPTVEEGRALLYDLGTVLDESGEGTRALAIFLELQSDAGDYRDVAERVERLSRAEAETQEPDTGG